MDRELFILIRVFISFVLKSVNLSIRTDLLKQENEKIDSL